MNGNTNACWKKLRQRRRCISIKKLFEFLALGSFGYLVPILLMIIFICIFIGAILAVNNGDGGGGGTSTLPAEIERYRSYVTAKCEEYQIPDAVDLVLAVMTQESHGKGADVMQCTPLQY